MKLWFCFGFNILSNVVDGFLWKLLDILLILFNKKIGLIVFVFFIFWIMCFGIVLIYVWWWLWILDLLCILLRDIWMKLWFNDVVIECVNEVLLILGGFIK